MPSQTPANSDKPRPRIWWCATGPFARLPIHAAGRYEESGKATTCCSDYVVSSYIPTLQSLISAQSTHEEIRSSDARILLGAAPFPYMGLSIPATVDEVRAVSNIVPSELIVSLDAENDVRNDPTSGLTASTALDILSHEPISILHIASHGEQDLLRPLDSGFLLRDRKLTISELTEAQTSKTLFLAFLSACETAKVAEEFEHETVHLASTMMSAGFKSVVGTMW